MQRRRSTTVAVVLMAVILIASFGALRVVRAASALTVDSLTMPDLNIDVGAADFTIDLQFGEFLFVKVYCPR